MERSPRLSAWWCLAATALAVGLWQRAEAVVTHGVVNIVAAESGGRVVAASSEARDKRGAVDPRWRKENLIDGKHVEGDIVPADSFGWATARPPSVREPAWAVFAFAQDKPRLIGAVRLDPRTEDPQVIGRWVKNFTVEVSVTTPEGPWERVDSFELINVPRPQEFVFGAPVRAKYVRLLITANQGSNSSVSLGEFEVLEALVSDDELLQVISDLEDQLDRLKRYALAHPRGGHGALTNELPPYDKSLLAAANGGEVVRASSEAADDKGAPLPQWQASNLIDGRIATPDQPPEHNSFGWSSNAAPTEEKPEWVVLKLPQDPGAIIDAAVVDTTTRDPWGIGRGAQGVELAVSMKGLEGPWTTIGRWTLPQEPRAQLLRFPPVEARFVRLTARSNYGSNRCVELGELAAYRLDPGVDPLTGIADSINNSIADLKRYYEASPKQTQ